VKQNTDAANTKEKWNRRYEAAQVPGKACAVLHDYRYLLPRQESSCVVLDLACGLGGNALYLAHQGFETHAWDISEAAIVKLEQEAQTQKLTLHAQVRDVLQQPPEPGSFDVIVVSRFLERSLSEAVMAALKPGGLLFYQTFVQDKDPSVGPSNSHFLLQPNELRCFAPCMSWSITTRAV